ncbi:ATP-binding protein [Desulfoplanes formicivorans]|uniref:histidine kinase n=1 Tax=Desulfoplanes formicivorans TaxID=1592317 RepID=A0A194AKJ6_9BACT|nr:ATP-binding protein [Desulfoplanes formicivorans]GAU09234.1 histidine kinase [Desulfoplanes formicivorans]
MENNQFRKLGAKITGLTVGFSVIPLLLLGITIYYQFSKTYTAKITENLATLVTNKARALDLFLDERIAQLRIIAGTQPYAKVSQAEHLEDILRIIRQGSESFIDLGVIDQQGNHVAYCGPYNLQGINYKNEKWFHEVMARGVYVSDVFMGFRKFPHLIIAVMYREGNTSWILRATIDSGVFESLVRSIQQGTHGDAYLVNAAMQFQTTPRFGLTSSLKDHLGTPSRFSGPRIIATSSPSGDSLFGLQWLQRKDWMLIVREDPKEELSPLLRTQHYVLATGLAGMLIILMGTLILTRLMIRQLMRAEQEKALLDESLLQSSKMAALGKMAAGVAHEVNNPLAVIKEKAGWIRDLLEEEDVKNSENFQEFRDSVDKIETHVDRAKKVVHRLLGFARRMEPLREKVDVNAVLEQTLSFLENEAKYRNISITTSMQQNLPRILSDTSQLQQVFLNILNNAIDAIGKGGDISISTQADLRTKELHVTITDSGPGIPRDIEKKIFDPFFTTKQVGKGTGLGLAISYSIIDKLGGTLRLENARNKGASFIITLPLTPQEG